MEHLYERAWYSVSETLLAMTIFRNDFNAFFLTLFAVMMLSKSFHWLLADRVELLQQTPTLPPLYFPRMVALIAGLAVTDFWLFNYCFNDVFANGPSMMMMFAFEYAIMSAAVMSSAIRFKIYHYDHSHPDLQWDSKSVYLFVLDLFTDFVKLCAYIAFFAAVMQEYGLPIHIIRDVYLTVRSFLSRIKDLIQYRRAVANLNDRYLTATEEELVSTDRTCIICREDMRLQDNPKKLPCGHIFHFRCLRTWLERQQSCPTCRTSVLPTGATQTTAPAVNNDQQPVPNHQFIPPQDQQYPAQVAQALAQPPQQTIPPQTGTSTTQTSAPPNYTANFAGIGTQPQSSTFNQTSTATMNDLSTVGQHTQYVRLIPLFPPGTRPNQAHLQSSIINDLRNNSQEAAGASATSASDAAAWSLIDESSRDGIRSRLQTLNRIKSDCDSMTAKLLEELRQIDSK